ncbi:MAG TPA: DUF4388 domain-containing protein [Pyrinomonadaceae bacterium]
MKTDGHLRDTPLPVLCKILADAAESGCLRIDYKPEPAFFHFNKGVLVGARMNYLSGFAAVHVAISRPDVAFFFDRDVAPPETTITDGERLLLSRVLEVVDDKAVSPLLTQLLETTPPFMEKAPVLRDVAEPVTNEWVVQKVVVDDDTNASVVKGDGSAETEASGPDRPSSDLVPLSLDPDLSVADDYTLQPNEASRLDVSAVTASDWEKVSSSSNRSTISREPVKYLTNQQLLRTAAAILVIAVPAAVGLAVRLTKQPSETPVAVSGQQSPSEQASSVVSPSGKNSPSASRLATVTSSPATPHLESSHTLAPEKNVKAVIKDAAPQAKTEQPESKNPEADAMKTDQSTQPEKSSTSSARTIMVVVRIEDGHVAEAWVKNSRKGLEAYEATAIRLVRQRHYSKDTTRTETVPVGVTINQ